MLAQAQHRWRRSGRARRRAGRGARGQASAIGWLVLGGGLCWGRSATAAQFEVEGDVAAQGYEVVSPWGDVILGRRRLTSTLALGAYGLQGEQRPFAPDYSVRLRLRLDRDFGVLGAEQQLDPADPSRFVPGLDRLPVDLMFGYVEGRNLLGGLFAFRLGRQPVTDVLGLWSFDGALIRVTTPFFLQAELYGGLEERGGLPLSSARYEQQGVWRGSHRELGPRAYDFPSYQEAGLGPAFGFALDSVGPNWIHGRFDYRRVYSLAPAWANQFPAAGGGFEQLEGLRISQERFGYALSAWLAELGAVRAGFAYDVYIGRIGRAYAAADLFVNRRLTLGADTELFLPTFDADSIWSWFAHNPSVTAQARVSAKPLAPLVLVASAGTRLWMTDGDPSDWAAAQCAAVAGSSPEALADCLAVGIDPTSGPAAAVSRSPSARATALAPDLLAQLGAGYRWGTGSASLGANLQTGLGGDDTNRGRHVGATIAANQSLYDEIVWLGGQLGTYEWHDPLRPERDGISLGYVLAPELRPFGGSRLRVEWEHDLNRLVGQRFRLVGILAVGAGP